ncbi:MAG TPA: KTSC domain-containing protein [Opitutaceae bacterium]|nr:KTSC domain-containing protein [Opitutaceae bacterium]
MPSEVIANRSYDPDTRTLFITFTSGELYAYDGVEPETWNALQQARSKGRFFQKHIRDRYPYGRVEDPSAVRLKRPA